MASDGVPFWVQAVTALSAVVGPIVTAMVANRNVDTVIRVARHQTTSALQVADRQVRAAVVSANRQKWIDALREDIAAFLTESDGARARLAVGTLSSVDVHAIGRPMVLIFNRTRLRINPAEADHRELIALMDKVLDKIDSPQVKLYEDGIAETSQRIFKKEWVRVKNGE
jgi:hypothetical protein